jgi:hypothetical protein
MFNPVDTTSTEAMVHYRQESLSRDRSRQLRNPQEDPLPIHVFWIGALRRSVGLSIMRLGARMAGTCLTPRVRAQL